MKHKTFDITVITVSDRFFDLETASKLSGIHSEIITDFERAHFVSRSGTDSEGNPVFDDAGICRLRLLRNLRDKEGLSLRMMKIVCHLMNRLERAEEEVRYLRNLKK